MRRRKGNNCMKNQWTGFLALLMAICLAVGSGIPASAAVSATAQANAYNKHSIGLTGVSNARELGGYKTKDGRTVKFGKLLRTGDLSDMTAADKKRLVQKYRPVKVVDFRSNRDLLTSSADPQLGHAENVRYAYSSFRSYLFTPAVVTNSVDYVTALVRQENKGLLVYQEQKDSYGAMFTSEDGIAMFRGFFDALLDADGGTVLFHCAGGKDRTGNAAMLLLTVLGVDKETIVADYLLTNDYLADEYEEYYDIAYTLTRSKSVAKDIALLKGVHRDWIEASFETIESRYGSVENYLHKVIGLSNKDFKKLQKAYLK